MKSPNPFIYQRGNTRQRVTAEQATDLVTEKKAHCHQFRVNPAYESPSVATLRQMTDELRLRPADGDSWLLLQCVREALTAAEQGRYGVGAVLANVRSNTITIVEKAHNERIKGGLHEYTGHAEMRLVDKATRYLQNNRFGHSNDIAAVNLCPCPGCLCHMVDAHLKEVVVGCIDPLVGAAYLPEKLRKIALGDPRNQVFKKLGLVYRPPRIDDPDLRELMPLLCWNVFHATRKDTHRKLHRSVLKE